MKNIFIILFIAIFAITGCGQGKTSEMRNTDDDIRYYTCGMHPSVKVSVEEYNKGNKSCPICNMNLTPVYKETEEVKETAKERKILFYRNPMNPGITSDVPTKDEMGMDYIPVYKEAGESTSYYGCGMKGAEHVFLMKDIEALSTCPICGMDLIELSKDEANRLKGVVSTVKIKGNEIRRAGVQTESVKKLHLYKEIRTVGRVAYDPGLAIAQEEFIASLNVLDKIQEGNIEEINERALNLVESSKRKLRLLGLSKDQIVELEEQREVQTSLILPEEKMWVYGDVYEYELSWVKIDAKVKITTSSLPGEKFYGVVSSINPVLDPKTRSLRFRAEVDNPDLKLKPEMYVDVVIMSMYKGAEGQYEVLAIPKDAVLDTGMRKVVWINKGNNEYEGRIVNIGPEATGAIDGQESKFYPVLSGLREGEEVVTKANFLIDSQSQLSGVAAAAYGGAVGVEEKKESAGHQH